MQTIRRIIRYLFYFLLILAALIVFNLAAVGTLQISVGESSGIGISLGDITSEFSFDEAAVILSPTGRNAIDMRNGFGLLLDENGTVLWRYRAPEELPDRFTVCDTAAFSRWYLDDYPVYSRIMENDSGSYLFLLGLPKNSVWRYNLVYDLPLLYSYKKVFPLILLIDLLLVFAVPLLLTRRQDLQRERERTEWIAGVSHDIRTPLALAILKTEKIIGEGNASDQEAAQQILQQELRLKSLVENLNADNRLRYGYGKRRRDTVRLSAAIRDTVCTFANANEAYDFTCDIAEEAEGCTVRADADLVRRMLENLIGNSIRHNPAGCGITVRLEASGRRSVLTVRDDGCGVDPQKLRELNAAAEPQAVTSHGLGLTIVRHIAQTYRWKLWYDSVENESFTCTVILH